LIDFGEKSLSFENCGIRESRFRRRRASARRDFDFLYGGVDAGKQQHPWHAALDIENTVKCGGTLVSRTAVVTAGHCVFDHYKTVLRTSEISVLLGMYDVSDSTERDHRQKIKARAFSGYFLFVVNIQLFEF